MPIVVVTGGASGIGRHLVNRFTQEGNRVVVLDINEPTGLPEGVFYQRCDVGVWADVCFAFERIRAEVGIPKILVNNAGIANVCKSILESDVEDFDRVVRVNLSGTYYCSKQFVELNFGAPNEEYRARIINIASTRYLQNEPHWDAYGASKGGIVSLTQSLSNSLAEIGILCNVISPGWIVNSEPEELTTADHHQHLSGRAGYPEDIYRACRYLCEADNLFLTGQNIIIDGGMTKRMIYV